jgi:predicted lipoprotein with Yx(FWY)xxD motif
MRRVRIGLLVGLTALTVTGAIASAADLHASKKTPTVKIGTRNIPGLGTVLVGGNGRTLYMFVPDKERKVTCTSKACVKAWPPLFLPTNGKPVATGSARQKLLGSDADRAGGRVVTYKGWPLYFFEGDTKNGVARGQDIDLTGGYWYVLTPSGALIKHMPTTTTTTTTTTTPGTTTTTGGTGTSTVACQDGDNDGDENAGGADDGDGCL